MMPLRVVVVVRVVLVGCRGWHFPNGPREIHGKGTNAPAFVKFVRQHPGRRFLEHDGQPVVSADAITKALRIKAGLPGMLNRMQ